MNEMSWSVYKHTFPNGKVYIGLAKDIHHRWRANGSGYKGSTRVFNAIAKYGWDNIKHEVLTTGLTREEACKMERDLISSYHSTNPRYGYNLLSGGECQLHSDETKAKIRNANLGHSVSANARKKISEARSEPIICLDTLEIFESGVNAGRHYGLSATSINKACIGKAQTAGGLRFAKVSDYKNGTIPEFIPKAKGKKVICITTGEIFASASEAAKVYGVSSQAISHCCTGKVSSSAGMKWGFADGNGR